MAKRFRDTDIWKKEWYTNLSPTLKCLISYLYDNCDNSGVWSVNKSLAEFQINDKINWNTVISDLCGQVLEISNSKWFITDFIKFQYGELSEKSPPHKNVFNLLEHHGIKYPIDNLTLPLPYPTNRVLDKDKDKDKDNILVTTNAFVCPDHLKEFWPDYIATRKKKKAVETNNALNLIVKSLEKLAPNDNETQLLILQQSIKSGWIDVYPIKNSNTQNNNTNHSNNWV
jgi:hypothetical protein